MALTGKASGGFDPVPEGQYVARCVRVVDLGSQHNEKWNKMQRKVNIVFEIPELIIDGGDFDGMPRVITERFSLSMAPKSHLRPKLESWRGKSFTDNEAEQFDILSLVGVACIINIIHNESGGKTYANIAAITPLMKGMECPAAKTKSYGFALTPDDFNAEILASMSDFTQEAIKKTPEYAALTGEPAAEYGNQPEETTDDGFDPNDDVPF